MANPERGEVEIVVNGRPYTLKLSTNAAVTFEKKEKKTIGTLLAEAGALQFESIRYFIWLLLQRHHKDEFKALDAVGDLIDDAGGIAPFLQSIQDVVALNQAPAEGETAVNPPNAQRDGTGDSSTEMPAA